MMAASNNSVVTDVIVIDNQSIRRAKSRTLSFTLLFPDNRHDHSDSYTSHRARMVYLNRIYTKAGDGGETSLGDGVRVPKTHLRIVAYGGVDELNATIGVIVATGASPDLKRVLVHIQNDLFDVGADLCLPESDAPPPYPPLRVIAEQVAQLERWIDEVNERLSPLTSFVLPGGSVTAAQLHVARTVCRRVEIGVIALAEHEPVNPEVTKYLNRLSDLLFVLARAANHDGRDDVLWVPGKNRGQNPSG
jgi:cob(I)alamin adenosyltransferase